MPLRLEPVQVAIGPDEEGMLVFADGRLVALLVRLSEAHEPLNAAGRWFLETSYGARGARGAPLFPDLEAAQTWIGEHLIRG